jgi:23S rRNA (uridine2552-2'-O)-methyltransferase
MGRTRKGLRYVPQDAYYHEAKKQGFVARSAFKLEELDAKYKLFRRGMNILDLGCAPGSWLQYAHRKTGGTGRIFGIDLSPVKVELSNTTTVVGDIYELKADDARLEGVAPVDLIQSDAMSKTTGIAESDCARSVALAEYALHIADKGVLKQGGAFVVKVFEGPGFTPFYVLFKKAFRKTAVYRAEATRKGSREVYVVGLEFRGLGGNGLG